MVLESGDWHTFYAQRSTEHIQKNLYITADLWNNTLATYLPQHARAKHTRQNQGPRHPSKILLDFGFKRGYQQRMIEPADQRRNQGKIKWIYIHSLGEMYSKL